MLHLPPQLHDSSEDTDWKVGDFFVGIEMGLVHAGVGGDEGNSFGLFLDALHGGLIAIDQDDGDVAGIDGRLLLHDDDIAFHGYLRSCGIIHTSSRYLSKCLYDTVSQLMFLAVFSFMVHFMVVCSLIS